MALFTINRYMGEPLGETEQKNSAQTILEKLNAKAREREKRLQTPPSKQKQKNQAQAELKKTADSPKIARKDDDSLKKSTSQKKLKGSKERLKGTVDSGLGDVDASSSSPSIKKKKGRKDALGRTSDVEGDASSSSPSVGNKKLAKRTEVGIVSPNQKPETKEEEIVKGKKQKRTKPSQKVSEGVSEESIGKRDSSVAVAITPSSKSPKKKLKRTKEESKITDSPAELKIRTSRLNEEEGEEQETLGNVTKKDITIEDGVTDEVAKKRTKKSNDNEESEKEASSMSPSKSQRKRTKSNNDDEIEKEVSTKSPVKSQKQTATEDNNDVESDKEVSGKSQKRAKKKSVSQKTKTSKANQDSSGVDPANDGELADKDFDNGNEGEDGDEMEVDSDDEQDNDVEDSEEDNPGFVVLGDFEKRSKKKVQETLPDWLAHPAVIQRNLSDNCVTVDSVKGLDTRLVSTLKEMGIINFFPVQHHVIPIVLDSLQHGMHTGEAGFRPRDLCVSAPTGSGKTLAYSLPIVQALIDRVIPRVRALVVLPTRDLATQVHKVITSLCKNTPLRAVLIGGTKKFSQEQSLLVKEQNGEYQSLADIVVATPGRLVDNINHTPGFNLHHLRFLVIDEADRMMDQITQDWIAQVEKSAYGPSTPVCQSGIVPFTMNSVRPRPGPLTIARASAFELPLQKLLFSATLSQNPEKLTQLRLFQPRLVTTATGSKGMLGSGNQYGDEEEMDVDGGEETGAGRNEFVGKYTTPVGLSEYFVQCTAGEKPLVLMHLLSHLYFKQVLCFTNTVEATHRLCLLLRLMGGVEVEEFSSNLQQAQRQTILKQFKAGKIQILICSDAMARGMDIDNVKCVISYDLPPHLKTYIHRVGRTARAGRGGSAFSFIRKKEVTKFKQMLRNAGKDGIQRHHMTTGQLESLVPSYTEALSQLPALLKEEKSHHF